MRFIMRQITKYTDAIKSSVLAKALAPNGPSVIELAKEFNIPRATIHTWVFNMKHKDNKRKHLRQGPKEQSAAFKLQAVMDTLGKSEEEQSAYCRTEGIYYNQIEEWKQQIMESLGAVATASSDKMSKVKDKENKAVIQKIQGEMKQLKSDLNRKERALAELTALLVLKKKADLLWGGNEDD